MLRFDNIIIGREELDENPKEGFKMKDTQIKAFFEEMLSSPEKLGDFNDVLEKSMSFFQEIIKTMQTATDEDKKKIAETLKGIESELSKEFDKLCEKAGVSRSELEKLIKDQSNFDQKDWAILQNFQEKLNKRADTKEVKKEEKPKVKKVKNSWITA